MPTGYWHLEVLWFALIAILWIGYFVLEGFDFGVGILMPFVSKDDSDRRVVLNTIGPVWDGNEVWLLTAGGATFAAFPGWYATLFSGFYLPLLIILVALIVRGVAFEYRGKRDGDRWRRRGGCGLDVVGIRFCVVGQRRGSKGGGDGGEDECCPSHNSSRRIATISCRHRALVAPARQPRLHRRRARVMSRCNVRVRASRRQR